MAKSFDMEVFMAGVLTGAHATRRRHIRQAIAIQDAISTRWGRDNPWGWQRKHILWFWSCHLANHSNPTRRYYLVTICMIEARMARVWRCSDVRKA